MSNLKQIGLGIMQYTQDYDETMPLLRHPASNISWNIVTQPYIKSDQVFICPSISGIYITASNRISYGMNVSLGSNPTPTSIVGLSLASMNNPSELIMLADDYLERKDGQCDGYGMYSIPNDGGYPYLWWDPKGSRGGANTIQLPSDGSAFYTTDLVGPDARHLGGANAAYADGHVKWVKYDNLYTPPATLTTGITNWRQWYSKAQ